MSGKRNSNTCRICWRGSSRGLSPILGAKKEGFSCKKISQNQVRLRRAGNRLQLPVGGLCQGVAQLLLWMGVFLEPKNLEILFLNGLNILTFKYLPFIFFLFSGGSTFWRLGTYQNVPCRVRCLNTCLKCCKPTSSTSPDHESEIKHVSVLYNFNINQDHYWLII